MLETSQVVRIEKHRAPGDIAALTFEDAAAAPVPAPAQDRELVFVVHGLGGRKERHIETCLALAAEGFVACALDARFHGERATAEASSRLLGIEFAMAFAEAVIGTVDDLASMARYLGRGRYGIIGHSMGGYIALKAAVTDPRAAVIVSAAGNPDWTVTAEGTYLPPGAREFALRESPLARPERFWPRPVLLLHGDADAVVPVDGARSLYDALRPHYAGDPQRLSLVEYPRGGHEFTPDMAARAVAWMSRYLKETT
jgi:alpha-beta hydrolase superfamily lysophospholipase